LLAELAQCDVQIAEHAVSRDVRLLQLRALSADGDGGFEPRIGIEVGLEMDTQAAEIPVPLVRHVVSGSVAAEQVT
jgi:hypothetical protein